ncbi:MAG TPA: 4-hydroxythreonine-4-phosphate dehydrogenase PdxA [Devosia sp.]|nr:4-hydroxythreonine-4-phosphate dehydrogenase PdxA [Devosia sp.]
MAPWSASRSPLAVSMGEPAGIGPDLVLMLYARRKELRIPPFLVYGNLAFLKQRASGLGLSLDVVAANPTEACARFSRNLPVADIETYLADTPGQTNPVGGELVLEAIARAAGDCLTRACRALITAPVNKAALKKVGFTHPGHTEYLAELCAGGGDSPTPVMMLAHDNLRVVPLTIHVPVAQVPELITTQLVVRKARIVAEGLHNWFGIAKPRIAVTGLNPHAGEEATIGFEDRDEIAPAVALLRREGIDVTGPLPADTVFHPEHWQDYDAVLAMYHDQALIPIKTVAFEEAVNVTLGLPILRTSPDHGTAFDLAGSGEASTKSMLAAIRLADQMTASLR